MRLPQNEKLFEKTGFLRREVSESSKIERSETPQGKYLFPNKIESSQIKINPFETPKSLSVPKTVLSASNSIESLSVLDNTRKNTSAYIAITFSPAIKTE